MRRIKLLVDIYDDPYHIANAGDVIDDNEPYSGFNPDGSFTVCFGMGMYVDIPAENFEELKIKSQCPEK